MIERFTMDVQFFAIVGVSILCGGLVGLERQIRGKPAGMRTGMLVCLGTAVFVHLGAQLSGPSLDPARVLGQVVTGVGFLGAGVMFMREGAVLGVTTAAVIWVLAGIGSAIGLGQYHLGIALALAVLVILIGTEWLERTFAALTRGAHARVKRASKSHKDAAPAKTGE